jgi:hypothetical protein
MKKGNRNAMKHGAFAEMVILPDEDPEEFEALHRSLIDEWDPQGITQEDKVFSIAKNMWRKRRRARHEKDEIADSVSYRNTVDRFHQNEIDTFINVLEDIESGRPVSEQDLLARLPRRWAMHYKKYIPRKSFDTDSAWLITITARMEDLVDELVGLGYGRPKIGEQFCDAAFIEAELALDERLDAKIDKDIVALGRMKTMQAMGLGRRRNGQAIEGEPMKQVDSPPMHEESTHEVDADK